MDKPEHRPSFIVGTLAEYLGISAGKANGMPVGVMTFRPHVTSLQSQNLIISRAALERLREDIDFLLAHSAFLKEGEPPEITLAEIEAIHERLG